MSGAQWRGVLRRGLPGGATPVAGGLVILGLGSVGFLVLSGRALGPERFGALSLFWMVLHTVGPGLFLPLEQELARAVAARAAHGAGSLEIVRRAAVLAAVGTTGVWALSAAASPLLTHRLFQGDESLVFALGMGTAAMAGSYWARGLLAGAAAWPRYAAQLGVDGALRLAGVAVLLATGTTSTAAYAALLVCSLALSTIITVGRPGNIAGASKGDDERLTRALGWLLLASAASMLLLNAAPLAVAIIAAPGDTEAAGNFVAALVLARIPLFMFAAVSAALLPTLTRNVARADMPAFRSTMARLAVGIGGIGGVGVLASAAVGPVVVSWVYGEDFRSSRMVLVLLAASTMGLMAVSALSQALVAVRDYPAAAAGPLAGVLLFVMLCFQVGTDVAADVAWALVAAVAVSVCLLAASLLAHTRGVGSTVVD